MPFSWKATQKRALQHKIGRCKRLAHGKNPDFVLKHPAWTRDAEAKNYTQLVTEVTKQVVHSQEIALARRKKIAGK